MTTDTPFFKTPSRRRINADESAKGFRMSATAEGEGFDIKVAEGDESDIGKTIETNLGLELASIIIETRKIFKEKGIPLAIPDLKKFIESQSSVLPAALSAKTNGTKAGDTPKITPFTPPRLKEMEKKK